MRTCDVHYFNRSTIRQQHIGLRHLLEELAECRQLGAATDTVLWAGLDNLSRLAPLLGFDEVLKRSAREVWGALRTK